MFEKELKSWQLSHNIRSWLLILILHGLKCQLYGKNMNMKKWSNLSKLNKFKSINILIRISRILLNYCYSLIFSSYIQLEKRENFLLLSREHKKLGNLLYPVITRFRFDLSKTRKSSLVGRSPQILGCNILRDDKSILISLTANQPVNPAPATMIWISQL